MRAILGPFVCVSTRVDRVDEGQLRVIDNVDGAESALIGSVVDHSRFSGKVAGVWPPSF
jgi:hypothetical protein